MTVWRPMLLLQDGVIPLVDHMWHLKVFDGPILLLVWNRLFRIWRCWHHWLYTRKVGVIPKKRMGTATHAHPSFGMTMTKTLRSIFSSNCIKLHTHPGVNLFYANIKVLAIPCILWSQLDEIAAIFVTSLDFYLFFHLGWRMHIDCG